MEAISNLINQSYSQNSADRKDYSQITDEELQALIDEKNERSKAENYLLKVNDLQTMPEKLKMNLRSYKSTYAMSYDQFKDLIKSYARIILLSHSEDREFAIDKNNEPIIRNLYLYFTDNPKCEWNRNAGLLFGGKVGCGKTVLMSAYLRISDEFSQKSCYSIYCKAIASAIKNAKDNKAMETLYKLPIYIDDIGKETTMVKDYGTIVQPVIDLIGLRDIYGARTYGTTNFRWETLETYYGEFIRSRMQAMMTFVVIPGESRRLKNEIK